MLSDVDVESHYNPSVRLIEIEKNGTQCGFHLTRGKWDPYPWVSSVDVGSAAATAGVKPGDCLVEVNGEDIIGQRISDIAQIVKTKPEQVSLLLWNAGVDPQCTPEALCCGPLPRNLQRLSACMTTILAFLECPICLDTISPPTYQCDNGHLICIRCRTKSERCPVCRVRFGRSRSLLSDQVYNALIDAFDLREDADESRSAKIQHIFKQRKKKGNVPDIKVTPSHTNKFIAKIIGKASSVDNLSLNTKLLSPSNASRYDNDFASTNLKRKSLSTNELFHRESPNVSRSGSTSRLNGQHKTEFDTNISQSREIENRLVSHHESFEFLESNHDKRNSTLSSSLGNLNMSVQDELYHCPFSVNCTILIKGESVFDHFQKIHGSHGPLVQYFSPNIKIHFKKIEEDNDMCCVVSTESSTYFLKIYWNKNIEDGNLTYTQDILIWVWYLGNRISSRNYETKIEIKSTDTDDTLLGVRASIFSLETVGAQEIIDHRKGIFLSSKTLQSLKCSSKTQKLTLDISLLKCDT